MFWGYVFVRLALNNDADHIVKREGVKGEWAC